MLGDKLSNLTSSSTMKIHNSSFLVKNCELHACLGPLMRLCRWFGCFPVENLPQSNPSLIRYQIKSAYGIYFLTSFLGQLSMSVLSFTWFLESNLTLGGLSNFLFYATGVAGIIFLFRMAKQWTQLLKKATEIEQTLDEIRVTKNTSLRTNIIVYFVMFLALVEHILSKVFNIKLIMCCTGQDRVNFRVIENFFIIRNSFIFSYVQYNAISAIMCTILVFQATFLWSFTDLIIMCFSIYLTSYFEDLNRAINSYKKKEAIPWTKFRLHYANIVILLKEIDSQLSSFVLLSFFTNLFYICFQLFNSLHRGYFEEKYCDRIELEALIASPSYLTYYLFSFVFLVLRAITLSVLAANVNSAAQEPLLALYEVPSSIYNTEVHRFQLQLRYTTIGLSGIFFYVTRKMILRVLGTVITYELVLLQFSASEIQQIIQSGHNITSSHDLQALSKKEN